MNSLSSMSPSCLQNRDPSSYYSMFHHDPLSSLSASYGRSCGASQSAASAINSHMGSYGSSLTSSSSSTGSGSSGTVSPSSISWSNTLLYLYRKSPWLWNVDATSSTKSVSRYSLQLLASTAVDWPPEDIWPQHVVKYWTMNGYWP